MHVDKRIINSDSSGRRGGGGGGGAQFLRAGLIDFVHPGISVRGGDRVP